MAKRVQEIEELKATYKRLFFRGLAALLPTILTVYLLIVCYQFIDQNVATPLNSQIQLFLIKTEFGNWLATRLWGVEEEAVRQGGKALETAIRARYSSWVGAVVGLLIVFLAGAFITSFIGRKLWAVAEERLSRLPVIRTIYPYAKQITDFIFTEKDLEKKQEFQTVVAVEYPRKGQWSLGFVTGPGFKSLSDHLGQRFVNVFIPSAPTPVTGYVIFVAEDEVIPIPATVDDVFRFNISGGVLIPPAEREDGHPPEAVENKGVSG